MYKTVLKTAGVAICGGFIGYILGRKQEQIVSWMKEKLGIMDAEEEFFEADVDDILQEYQRMNKKEERPEEDKEKIKQRLKDNWERTTNYATMYQVARQIDQQIKSDLGIHSPSNHYKIEDPNEASPEVNTIIAFHDAHKNDPPEWIDDDQLDLVPPFIQREELFYYTMSYALTDEEGSVIEDPTTILGDLLEDTGFLDDDREEYLYILNYQTDTLYMVHKIEDVFGGEEV